MFPRTNDRYVPDRRSVTPLMFLALFLFFSSARLACSSFAGRLIQQAIGLRSLGQQPPLLRTRPVRRGVEAASPRSGRWQVRCAGAFPAARCCPRGFVLVVL